MDNYPQNWDDIQIINRGITFSISAHIGHFCHKFAFLCCIIFNLFAAYSARMRTKRRLNVWAYGNVPLLENLLQFDPIEFY